MAVAAIALKFGPCVRSLCEIIHETERLPGDFRTRIRCNVIWHWIGDARMQQHRGWRRAYIASTCRTNLPYPILHLCCISSPPNRVDIGM